jgi:hypothetical protein
MTSATVTITNINATPRNLFDLLTNGTGNGYTVVPATGPFLPINGIAGVSYCSVQSSYTNGGVTVYKGDEKVANNGTRQSKEMQPGDTDVMQASMYSVNLNEIFLMASANGAIINVEVHYT